MAQLPSGAWRRYGTVLLVSVAAVILYAYIDLTYSLPWNPDRPSLPMFPAAPLAKACDGTLPPSADDSAAAPIPNIVHYIWLLADPTVLSLDFKVFISVYSAHLFFRPDKVYFHTDASPELWERTKASGSDWSRRVLNLPNVEPKYIDNPRLTTKGVEIDTFGAKSDFIRAYALRDLGGIYLDVDATPCATWRPCAGPALPTSWAAMDAFYNGVWAISVGILTDLAYRLHAVPGEVLIMNPRAFAPASFELADTIRLFRPYRDAIPFPSAGNNDDDGPPQELTNTCSDALAWLRQREQHAAEPWKMDFSATYVLHAFDDDASEVGGGWDGKITLPYVLARRSNYARAVYPAIHHAIKAGVIPAEETA
ncbi:hypothetical protein PG996_008761 [Apiospora saccharicola]|uniref:Glycosyl transferase n=1 Tax=Apiospora saccharicola TaxID=335842 RepID=A0ABR1UYV0_9PEZI